jgi:hypothetical protein
MTLTIEQIAELDRMRARAETGEQWAEVCKREAEMEGVPATSPILADPNPYLRNDWRASRANWDLGMPFGYGRTKEAAIADLLEQEAERA